MKKYLLAFACAAMMCPAYAGIDEGIDPGMIHISALGGLGIPVTQYESAGEKDDFGDIGGTYGLQIMYHIAPAFGMGVEFTGTNFTNYNSSFTNPVDKVEFSNKATKYQFMLAGKISLSPQSKTRVYFPLGAGFAKFKPKGNNKTYSLSGTLLDEESWSDSMTKPAVYAGIGFESDLNDIFVFGAEARYNVFWVDKDKVPAKHGYLSDATILLKLGIKI